MELATGLLSRFGDGEKPIGAEILSDGLSFPRGPGDFDAIDLRIVAQAEVNRHNTVGEIT